MRVMEVVMVRVTKKRMTCFEVFAEQLFVCYLVMVSNVRLFV